MYLFYLRCLPGLVYIYIYIYIYWVFLLNSEVQVVLSVVIPKVFDSIQILNNSF